MSREKQIEEMAKELCGSAMCDLETYNRCRMPRGNCSRCQRVAEDLYNAGYRKQEWISVEERLPKECKNVLCFARNKIVLAFMEKTEDCGEYVPVFWDWVAYDRDDTYDEVCATHWMSLPEPPKMKGGE
jgi:hypothetical protein